MRALLAITQRADKVVPRWPGLIPPERALPENTMMHFTRRPGREVQ